MGQVRVLGQTQGHASSGWSLMLFKIGLKEQHSILDATVALNTLPTPLTLGGTCTETHLSVVEHRTCFVHFSNCTWIA